MPDPVLRIPVDDEAFNRYLEAFNRYQDMLGDQPGMWEETNSSVRDGVAANLALADSIGAAVAAAVRLGDTEASNAERRKRDAQNQDQEEERQSAWRRKALDHVQELSRTSASIVRGFGKFASGSGGTGGLFAGVSEVGKGLGGTLGGIVNLVGHAMNAGYEINNAVSDKGLFARGIGASISEQEGYRNNLGRFTNTDQGIDAVMNARGTPQDFWQFNALGVDRTKGTNAQVYGQVLRAQTELAERNRDKNGNINFAMTDPRGGSAFGTTHEDLNRLVGMSAAERNKYFSGAETFKSSLTDKNIDAATKSATATDNLATKLTDLAQHGFVEAFNPALDKATGGLTDLFNSAEKLSSFIKSFLPTVTPQTRSFLDRVEAPVKGWLGHSMDWAFRPMWGPSSSEATKALGASRDNGPLRYTKSSDTAGYKQIAEFLKRQGLSDASAFGSAAGAIAESHGNAHAYNRSSGAFGIGQWLGARKKALFAMAAREHRSAFDMETQMRFLASELKGGDAGGKHVLNASSVQDALHAYVYKFMRPEGSAPGRDHMGSEAQRDMQRGGDVVRAANVNLNIKVTNQPGAHAAVSANSAARGK